MKDKFRQLARQFLSRSTRRRIARMAVWPPVGWVHFGQLRRLRPFGTDFGNRRGLEIDRFYIEQFLADHAQEIQGHVLEMKDSSYTVRFGQERVTKRDVMHRFPGNPDATIVADLTDADHLPSSTFDTIIFTQTLQFIYDIHAAVATLYRLLKPGGVILATVSGLAYISRDDFDTSGEYWRFTSLSARRVFESVFPAELVDVQAHGNVLAAVAFLEGLACEDLKRRELEVHDPNYEILITIRAQKPEESA